MPLIVVTYEYLEEVFMGNLINLSSIFGEKKSKKPSPGINLGKWKSTYAIAAVLLVRLKEIRLLRRLVRLQDKRMAEAERIIKAQNEMLDLLKDQIERIKLIV